MYTGTGVELDKRKALKYYMMAAKQGHVNAQYNSGCMYINGEGNESDYGKAQKCMELAAAQGHQEAKEALAELQGANVRR